MRSMPLQIRSKVEGCNSHRLNVLAWLLLRSLPWSLNCCKFRSIPFIHGCALDRFTLEKVSKSWGAQTVSGAIRCRNRLPKTADLYLLNPRRAFRLKFRWKTVFGVEVSIRLTWENRALTPKNCWMLWYVWRWLEATNVSKGSRFGNMWWKIMM